jgi:hypothetical protein
MVLVQTTLTRPSSYIDFYTYPQEWQDYFYENYKLTKKALNSSLVRSADGMSIVYSTLWRDRACMDECYADPTFLYHFGIREEYNAANNITKVQNIHVL